MSSIPEDRVLIRRALKGDESAYADLVRRYQDRVSRLALRITRRPDLVPDLCQEVFIAAFTNLARFKRRSGFMTWLHRITVNASLAALRREEASSRMLTRAQEAGELPDTIIVRDQDSGERMLLNRELQLEIHEALDRLSAEDRAILTLRYLEEFSTPELAEILDLPPGTVRSKLYYARLKLAEILDPALARARRSPKSKES